MGDQILSELARRVKVVEANKFEFKVEQNFGRDSSYPTFAPPLDD